MKYRVKTSLRCAFREKSILIRLVFFYTYLYVKLWIWEKNILSVWFNRLVRRIPVFLSVNWSERKLIVSRTDYFLSGPPSQKKKILLQPKPVMHLRWLSEHSVVVTQGKVWIIAIKRVEMQEEKTSISWHILATSYPAYFQLSATSTCYSYRNPFIGSWKKNEIDVAVLQR